MFSYVVTGASHGIGRTIAQKLSQNGSVVVLDSDATSLKWTRNKAHEYPLVPLARDAGDDSMLEEAAGLAAGYGRLVGWINNATIFRDLDLHSKRCM